MNKYVLVPLGCALGLAACSQPSRVPDDAQLAMLLQRPDASPADRSPLDTTAVGCLRAWSGDAELARGLSVLVAGEDGRKRCRKRIEEWLDDDARNPAGFSFADVSTPDAARRAMALLEAAATASAGPGGASPPDELLNRAGPAPARTIRRAPPADGTTLEAALVEAETLCQQVAEAAAVPGADANVVRFAPLCENRLRRLRSAVQTAEFNGRSASQDQVANARNLANSARGLLERSAR